MKWTPQMEAKLKELCFANKSNAELAKTFNCDAKDIHAARSRLGITIPKIKAAKASKSQYHTSAATAPASKNSDTWSPVKKAFDALEKALMDAGQEDQINVQNFRHAAVSVSTTKSLLLAALAE